MKLNDKQFQLEIKNNHLGEYCVPFVSDDYKSAEAFRMMGYKVRVG